MDKETWHEWVRLLWMDAVDYLKITPDELYKKAGDNPWLNNATEWNNRSGSIEDFYKNAGMSQFIDEVSFHSRSNWWEEHFWPIDGVKNRKILDFGCGIGTSSLYLAMYNHVTGYEINKMCLDFCKFRQQRFKFNIGSVSFTDTCPDLAEFNMVVAIDVLEHLPNLRETLLEWGKAMKPGTEIYHVDMFENHPTDHPMHFDYKEEIDKWFKEAGFVREGLRLAVKL